MSFEYFFSVRKDELEHFSFENKCRNIKEANPVSKNYLCGNSNSCNFNLKNNYVTYRSLKKRKSKE